jgi:hypothetical protein
VTVGETTLLEKEMNNMKDIINRLCDLERRMAKIETQAIEQAEKQEKLCKYCGGIGRVVCNGKCMPEQEPVAWMYVNENGECEQIEYGVSTVTAPYIKLLYTAPPKRPVKSFSGGVPWYATDAPKHEDDDIQEYKKPWVGLTDLEVGIYNQQFNCTRLVRDIEALLRERNT